MFSHSGTIPSKIIRKMTGFEYSHVSLSLDSNLKSLYSFARRYIYNPFNSGFVEEKFDKGIFGIKHNITCKVYKLEITEEEYWKLKANLNYFVTRQCYLKYNFFGLLSPIIGIPIKRKDCYFCSQFVGDILGNSGIIQLNKDPIFITPKELASKIKAPTFYEGNMDTLKLLMN